MNPPVSMYTSQTHLSHIHTLALFWVISRRWIYYSLFHFFRALPSLQEFWFCILLCWRHRTKARAVVHIYCWQRVGKKTLAGCQYYTDIIFFNLNIFQYYVNMICNASSICVLLLLSYFASNPLLCAWASSFAKDLNTKCRSPPDLSHSERTRKALILCEHAA